MREIKFRGKDKSTEEWLIGHYLEIEYCDGKGKNSYIKRDGYAPFKVMEETVGQYTGIKDKNGTKIFEGDICVHSDNENYPRPLVVEWVDEFACFAFVDKGDFNKKYYFVKEDMKNIEVVGNIHDNKDLLK